MILLLGKLKELKLPGIIKKLRFDKRLVKNFVFPIYNVNCKVELYY